MNTTRARSHAMCSVSRPGPAATGVPYHAIWHDVPPKKLLRSAGGRADLVAQPTAGRAGALAYALLPQFPDIAGANGADSLVSVLGRELSQILCS